MTVPRFVKAEPGHGEKARWIVWVGTGPDATPIGMVVCRVGGGYRSGGYWTAYELFGRQLGEKGNRAYFNRREAANAVLLHWERHR
jgi:hypothetical protein